MARYLSTYFIAAGVALFSPAVSIAQEVIPEAAAVETSVEQDIEVQEDTGTTTVITSDDTIADEQGNEATDETEKSVAELELEETFEALAESEDEDTAVTPVDTPIDMGSLLTRSPFMLGGIEPIPIPTPTPIGPPPSNLEFNGYMQADGEWAISIYDTRAKQGYWVNINDDNAPVKVASFDFDRKTILIQSGSKTQELRLKTAPPAKKSTTKKRKKHRKTAPGVIINKSAKTQKRAPSRSSRKRTLDEETAELERALLEQLASEP